MTLTLGAALALVGTVMMFVTAWAVWLSLGSSRSGPEWALGHLGAWSWMPWGVAIFGLVLLIATRPPWTGVAVIYIAAATGWLMRRTRRTLDSVRETYGFD